MMLFYMGTLFVRGALHGPAGMDRLGVRGMLEDYQRNLPYNLVQLEEQTRSRTTWNNL